MAEAQGPWSKRETGIPGLDAATHGGLPAVGATLVLGASGAGKTVLGLQILALAVERGETGLFLSFEESGPHIERDYAGFAWGPGLRASGSWEFVDARPLAVAGSSGGFDLDALLAAMGMHVERGASWIVVDGIDQLLRLEPDPRTAVAQITRLDEWCESHGVTMLLTGKPPSSDSRQAAYLEGIEYMLAAVLQLSAEVVDRRLNRRFRVVKYRGTAHATDEIALLMDDGGVHVLSDTGAARAPVAASVERVSTGVPGLDECLGGGLYRGSLTLVSGQPGTAKTTLAASFARAAAGRGERVLYISFDELSDRIVRNLASVGIELGPHIESGRLHIRSREAWSALVEEHYVAISRLLDEYEPESLVIDPVSALTKVGGAEDAYQMIERLLSQARKRGITTFMTSLGGDAYADEATLAHASTLADTWITLAYHVRAGERNRSLSVVKSRGSGHSNQVRELILSSRGIELAEVYEFGTEVLMGTARLQRASEEKAAERRRAEERDQRRRDLERRVEQARLQAEEARGTLQRLEEELEREHRAGEEAEREALDHQAEIRRQRAPGSLSGTAGGQ